MARKFPESYASPDITLVNLTHLLARLENNLISPSADLKLVHRSPYHRARVGANIEYSRTLLMKLELSLPNIKIQARKLSLQTNLAHKRQQIKALKARLDEITAIAEAEPDTQTFSSDNEEDLLPTPSDSTPETTSPPPPKCADLAPTKEEETKDDEEVDQSEEGQTTQEGRHNQDTLNMPTSPTPIQPLEPSPSNTLRSRLHHHDYSSSTTTPTATTTATSNPTLKHLFPHRPTAPIATTTTTTTPQAALSQNEAEQDSLTTSLLALATQLKTSTQNLHTSLESEKSILARAAEGLDRSTAGMEAAGKRMGAVRRMAEGKGWWGRMLMYAWIFALWVVALLIVFVGPKLRF
ncbi:synaptobrevin [Histoplasma capsulatum H143]|uniref:Synaptobrevin n=1 Tax=Ajellomyces capsulatus (strain H143) TaxID=544712 RepID=C6HFS3_AJECH|nr:synaptobrevin [Histoplasma capsulatum H143]